MKKELVILGFVLMGLLAVYGIYDYFKEEPQLAAGGLPTCMWGLPYDAVRYAGWDMWLMFACENETNPDQFCTDNCNSQPEKEEIINLAISDCEAVGPSNFVCESPCGRFIEYPDCEITEDRSVGVCSHDNNIEHCYCNFIVKAEGEGWYGCEFVGQEQEPGDIKRLRN